MTPPAAPTLHPKRCVIVKSCRDCPWLELTTMAGIIDNPDGTPKQLIWCLGKDDSRIDLIETELDTIHKDCPLPVTCSHFSTSDADARQRIEDVVKELEKLKENYALHYTHKDEDDWNDDPTFGDGAVDACTKAIALLKDGVERK